MDTTDQNKLAEQEPQPTAQSAPTEDKKQVNFVINDQNGQKVVFKMKTKDPMRKAFDAWCKRNGHDLHSTRFLFDGQQIDANATPESLDLQENDVIDAVLQQTGGLLIPRAWRAQ